MGLFAISDLHLCLGVDKPMDVFGNNWENYMDRLEKNWRATVEHDDVVILPGDISWGTYFEDAVRDFAFIDSLPGKKIISKGNHDYWWSTANKLNAGLRQHGFNTISLMHNNSYIYEPDNVAVCGTRGWKLPNDDNFGIEDEKIYKREIIRLELSLKANLELGSETVIAALHFPPINMKNEYTELIEVMGKYNVKTCIFGHLHGEACSTAITGEKYGIMFRLVSSDYLRFMPVRLI